MSVSSPRILVTGASGQLGALVITGLLSRLSPAQIVATVRRPDDATALRATGVEIRSADYDTPASLAAALVGIDKLLLISSSDVGARVPQHRNVIDAAVQARVGLLVYTSLLHADSSPLGLAVEHRATEALIHESGLPSIILRNGWYTENHLASLPAALEHGVVLGSAQDGRIASASRADYAAAAVAVLLADEDLSGQVYELAGDDAWTLTQFAAEISRLADRPVAYRDMPEALYKAALIEAGLPEPLADIFAESDAGAAKGGLFDRSGTLGKLIGRPTTPLALSIQDALNVL